MQAMTWQGRASGSLLADISKMNIAVCIPPVFIIRMKTSSITMILHC